MTGVITICFCTALITLQNKTPHQTFNPKLHRRLHKPKCWLVFRCSLYTSPVCVCVWVVDKKDKKATTTTKHCVPRNHLVFLLCFLVSFWIFWHSRQRKFKRIRLPRGKKRGMCQGLLPLTVAYCEMLSAPLCDDGLYFLPVHAKLVFIRAARFCTSPFPFISLERLDASLVLAHKRKVRQSSFVRTPSGNIFLETLSSGNSC